MSPSKRRRRRVTRFTLAARAPHALLLLACSADDAPPTPDVVAPLGSGSGIVVPPGMQEPGALIDGVDDGSGEGSSGVPRLGTETLCDGIDENGNGIIDDVDVGRDGLCDCIRLGFFGEVSSDAGGETAAFQAWLEERSGQIPVQNLRATETLTAEWLADLHVVIVGGMQERAALGAPFTQAELDALDTWLIERGGGVFTLAGYTESSGDAEPTNALLARLGIQYQTSGIAAAGVIGEGAPPIWLTGIASPDHPSVEGVEQFGFYFGYPVAGDGLVVMRDRGYDLAMAKEYGAGRVFVFGDEWITQDVTWSGSVVGGNDPCQQPCNEQASTCRISAEQCSRCDMEPCSDPNDTDLTTCSKGCQPSCESETRRCLDYTAQCDACSADAEAREQATPRLWLNTIRWLTPANECQVEIPPTIKVR